jgi:FMN-dependent NADH-azoreductase
MESYSSRLAKAFLDAYLAAHSQTGLETLNVFLADLPPFEAPAAAAKYAVMGGQEPRDEAQRAWKEVIRVVDHFKSADMLVVSSPMWNFGIPYKLKQYIDILVQPGLAFKYIPGEGYKGLITGRPAVLLLARGGEYPPGTPGEKFDMQKPYLEGILRFIGFTDIHTILTENTLAGPEAAEAGITKAIAQAQELAMQISVATPAGVT